jgi:hypothetical protein
MSTIYWALIDEDNQFELHRIYTHRLKCVCTVEVGDIRLSRSTRAIKILSTDGQVAATFIPISETTIEQWLRAHRVTETVPVPIRFFFMHPAIPPVFYSSFYHSLTSDDGVVLRALVDSTSIPDSLALMSALLDIFAHVRKVNLLLTSLAATPTNPHLTGLIRVFSQRFGWHYFRSVLVKMIRYILEPGDIHVSQPEQCDGRQVLRMVATCLHTILGSGPLVPPELRHIGSVLRAAATFSFDEPQEVFKILSDFFCVKFINGALSNPAAYGYPPIPPDVLNATLVPFAQLLVVPMMMGKYSGIYEHLRVCNHHLTKHVFPHLMEFVLSVADIEQVPEYESPGELEVRESIEAVIRIMVNRKDAFEERYQALLNATHAPGPTNWKFGVFLLSMFQDFHQSRSDPN